MLYTSKSLVTGLKKLYQDYPINSNLQKLRDALRNKYGDIWQSKSHSFNLHYVASLSMEGSPPVYYIEGLSSYIYKPNRFLAMIPKDSE